MTDPGQTAAVPLKTVSAADLVRSLQRAGAQPDNAEAAEAIDDNRKAAANELSWITALRDNPDFLWFEREFIIAPYDEAFEKLREPVEPGGKLELIENTYLALKNVRKGMIEREITHRETLDPRDTMIATLRQKLSQL